ncbi:phosphatase PAP2 family protein [Kitasatospora sp. NBC_01287]|uniref:bifunctional phosphatase PAP2/diacylglycerol kinase family protein n=1 Tax=Kitasatospora sp. NBC_01287 TaxID=2903573 RepID=UPI0022595D97|nr:bifunctional phosphatase PAP2/diacylglycerol kinase family protein [Kitasatospora sp. NBC_01287]MCX4744213.1 phosphatase PAP2 family protein [Kitasatospora sp. NBC_01287]
MKRIDALDRRLFVHIARSRWPGAEWSLPRLSRAADHGVLWGVTAAGLALGGTPRARRAAGRAMGSLLVASALANVVAKRASGRARPELGPVPAVRHLRRAPFTTSFPSGHSASAAAFTVGLGLESPVLGAALVPLAASVMFSRVYVGAHYPGDVLAGAALGAGAAALLGRWRPAATERRRPPAAPAGPEATLPALPRGRGLHLVVNDGSGALGPLDLLPGLGAPASKADTLRELLPEAEVRVAEAGDDLPELLAEAAERARSAHGALGVCGGDGTVNLAAARAAELGLPLAVFPGGTLNHFATDVGLLDFATAAAAVEAGTGIAVDLGEVVADGEGTDRVFLNTFSIGIYPDLVRLRERWEHRIGKWPALALAVARLLPRAEPVTLEIAGRSHRLWLLFAGNGRYRRRGSMAPVARERLDAGILDVRAVDAGHRFARTRLVAALLTGALERTPVYRTARLRSLRVGALREVRHLGVDGEAVTAPDGLLLRSRPGALRVYR